MARWILQFTVGARKELRKLTASNRQRVLKYLTQRVVTRPNPRSLGAALGGNRSGYWRYRVGDYRIIAELRENILTVLVVEVGNRRDVYR